MRTPLSASLPSLAALLIMAVSTTASPAPGPGNPLTRAVRSTPLPTHPFHHQILTKFIRKQRFNCPLDPSPAGISNWLYRDLYSYCTSGNVDCDCYPSNTNPAGPPSRVAHLNVNRYEVICRRPTFTSSDNLQMIAALNVCRESCMCYGGPVENWLRHPRGPNFVGPWLPLAGVQAASGPPAEKQLTAA
jgi:hypothetical protein